MESGIAYVRPSPTGHRRFGDQDQIPDRSGPPGAELRTELECGTHGRHHHRPERRRPGAGKGPLGTSPVLGQGYEAVLFDYQCPCRDGRYGRVIPAGVEARPTLPGADGRLLRMEEAGPERQAETGLCHRHGRCRSMAMAGLWDVWKSPGGETIKSCTIITCEPNTIVEELHNRMPVIRGEDQWPRWLGEEPITLDEARRCWHPVLTNG